MTPTERLYHAWPRFSPPHGWNSDTATQRVRIGDWVISTQAYRQPDLSEQGWTCSYSYTICWGDEWKRDAVSEAEEQYTMIQELITDLADFIDIAAVARDLEAKRPGVLIVGD